MWGFCRSSARPSTSSHWVISSDLKSRWSRRRPADCGSLQSELPQDWRKALVVSQRIEPRVDLHRDEIERAIVAGLREPAKTDIEVPQRELNPGELERRDVPLAGIRLEFAQHLEGPLAPARQRQRASERPVHARGLRRQVDGALKRGEGLVEVAPLRLNQPEQPVGGREVRVELDGVVALGECGLKVATVVVNLAEVARED